MRRALCASVLAGCGAVNLGTEPGLPDAGIVTHPPEGTVVGPLSDVQIDVRVVAEAGCDGCYELSAKGQGGRSPYTFEWDDGSELSVRTVCTRGEAHALSVVARDADGQASASFRVQLEAREEECPPSVDTPLLCVQNPSFEGTPGANLGFQPLFDAEPWSDCTEDGHANTPDILNEKLAQLASPAVAAPDGDTFVGMVAGEQVTQNLCAPLKNGESVSVQLEVGRLNVTAGILADTKSAFLEIWGGVAADCSARELLWASPILSVGWKTFCVELTPSNYMDSLSLRANSGDSRSAVAYVIIDNLRQVSRCP